MGTLDILLMESQKAQQHVPLILVIPISLSVREFECRC